LRNQTVDLTKQLRAFEAQARETERVRVMAEHHGLRRLKTVADLNKEEAERDLARSAHRREYTTRFHGDVMALYDVLRDRVGDLENEPYGIPPLLQAGMLAGVNPIQEAADYLDKMARRLQ
jgi:hypothetical protein